jgi:integrase
MLRRLRQADLDGIANSLYRGGSAEIRNRQCYTPFIAFWNQLSSSIGSARRRLMAACNPIGDISPYTARHTVSMQLVINGVHSHIKDQILGHSVDSMSRHYTSVPQAPLIEAINTLPVPPVWKDLPWWDDPLTWSRKHIRW